MARLSCPRCNGYVYLEMQVTPPELTCLMCGWVQPPATRIDEEPRPRRVLRRNTGAA